jgi:hypothetical protein
MFRSLSIAVLLAGLLPGADKRKSSAGDDIQEAGSAAKTMVVRTGTATGKATKTAAVATKDGTVKAAEVTKDATVDATKATGRGIARAGKFIGNGTRDLVNKGAKAVDKGTDGKKD